MKRKYVVRLDEDEVEALNKLGIETEEEKDVEEDDNAWPKEGDAYYYITVYGGILYSDKYTRRLDEKQLAFGNIFKTREEAEFALEKLKVLHELSKYTTKNYLDPHYVIYGDQPIVGIKPVYHEGYTCIGTLIFESKEKAQEAIDAIGEDRIMKYI